MCNIYSNFSFNLKIRLSLSGFCNSFQNILTFCRFVIWLPTTRLTTFGGLITIAPVLYVPDSSHSRIKLHNLQLAEKTKSHITKEPFHSGSLYLIQISHYSNQTCLSVRRAGSLPEIEMVSCLKINSINADYNAEYLQSIFIPYKNIFRAKISGQSVYWSLKS